MLPSATVAPPNHTGPRRAEHKLALSALQREQQRASKGSVLPSATITWPHCAEPWPATPCRAKPQPPSQREQQGTPKCSVLPSATRTAPDHAWPYRAAPHLALPCPNHSPKRAAEEAEASCAAVCNCYHAGTFPTPPGHTQERRASPQLLSRESSREGLRPQCCCLQRLPDPTLPRHAPPRRAGPSWGLHQRMPSLIRLLQPACD